MPITEKQVNDIEFLSVLMEVVNQACATCTEKGYLDHNNLSVYEDVFAMLCDLGLMEDCGNERYRLNWDQLDQMRELERHEVTAEEAEKEAKALEDVIEDAEHEVPE